MSRVSFISANDLIQYSHANRHARTNATNMLEKYAEYMDETIKWDHRGKITTFRTPPSAKCQYTYQAIEASPVCE